MSTALIITMAGIGITATVAEKLLNAFGKSDMASFLNIAGLAGLGLMAIGIIIKLLQALATII